MPRGIQYKYGPLFTETGGWPTWIGSSVVYHALGVGTRVSETLRLNRTSSIFFSCEDCKVVKSWIYCILPLAEILLLPTLSPHIIQLKARIGLFIFANRVQCYPKNGINLIFPLLSLLCPSIKGRGNYSSKNMNVVQHVIERYVAATHGGYES